MNHYEQIRSATEQVLKEQKYQVYFLLVAIGLMLVSLSFTAKKINKTCKVC